MELIHTEFTMLTIWDKHQKYLAFGWKKIAKNQKLQLMDKFEREQCESVAFFGIM